METEMRLCGGSRLLAEALRTEETKSRGQKEDGKAEEEGERRGGAGEIGSVPLHMAIMGD